MENNSVLLNSLALVIAFFILIFIFFIYKFKKLKIKLSREKHVNVVLESLMLNNFNNLIDSLNHVEQKRLPELAVHITSYINNWIKTNKKIPPYLFSIALNNPEAWKLIESELKKTMNTGSAIFLASQSIVFKQLFVKKAKRMIFIEELTLNILSHKINSKALKSNTFRLIKKMFQSQFEKKDVAKIIEKFSNEQKKLLQKNIDNFINNLEPIELKN